MGNLEMMGTDEEAAYKVGLEFKQRLDKLENDFSHFKVKQGPKGEIGLTGKIGQKGPNGEIGEKGQTGQEGKMGYPGKNGLDGINGKNGIDGHNTNTIKHIYEPLPKEIEEKLGSLGSASSSSEAENRANKLLDDIENMKNEIHTLYREKYEEKLKAQEPPMKKSILKRLFRRD